MFAAFLDRKTKLPIIGDRLAEVGDGDDDVIDCKSHANFLHEAWFLERH
ncbi:hypothetical protein NML43_00325 [Rhodopseudomonas palustris]|nr:hypothetical protein [Rhodopseudomonas palustris]